MIHRLDAQDLGGALASLLLALGLAILLARAKRALDARHHRLARPGTSALEAAPRRLGFLAGVPTAALGPSALIPE